MRSKQPTSGDAILLLRTRCVSAYREAKADKVTKPAAFGVGCHIIQEELGCNLKVSAMLMDCWVTEDEAKK